MKRVLLGCAVAVVGLVAPAGAHADKLPTDKGLQITITPAATTFKVGKPVTFKLAVSDDDASSMQGSLEVQGAGGSGFSADGSCLSPTQRVSVGAELHVPAVFKKPGTYRVKATASSRACYSVGLGLGEERVVVTRFIKVTR